MFYHCDSWAQLCEIECLGFGQEQSGKKEQIEEIRNFEFQLLPILESDSIEQKISMTINCSLSRWESETDREREREREKREREMNADTRDGERRTEIKRKIIEIQRYV